MTPRLLFRWLALVTLAVWFGGFTFYSAVVIPVLHEVMGQVETGSVTRQITDAINLNGAVALGLWWALVVAEGRSGGVGWAHARTALLAVTTMILVGLFGLHRVMDGRLDAGESGGFRRLHQAYLIASTAQWFVNLALLAVSLRVWQGATRPRVKINSSADDAKERR